MTEKRAVGIAGEEAAIGWLRSHGFMIMERNWRCGRYEIDIVASRWGVVHFVEVKTRHEGSLTTPEQAIDDSKRRALRRGASAYSAMHRMSGDVQFDLAAVTVGDDGTLTVRYIENAIEYGW